MTDDVNSSYVYTFGSFTYRPSDNTLTCDDDIVSLPPKSLELLRIFLANPGKLFAKDELMNMLWPDTFVEGSNLAVTTRRLRKALDDDAHQPRYIETVARQGYRFVAGVSKTVRLDETEPVDQKPRPFRYLIPIAVAGALLIASISLGSRYLTDTASTAPILAAPFAAQKYSTSGKVRSASISPDGEKIVYAVRSIAGEAVWLREVSSGNNVEIIPAVGEKYYRFAFAPDGSTLYFTRGARAADDPADLYRISIFGGVPTKIVNDTRGWISVAPDGSRISFVRCKYRDEDYCSLWTADSRDGKNEKLLTSSRAPIRIGDNEISPDGKSVIFASGQSRNASAEFGLSSIDLETGVERELLSEKFFEIRSIEVLPDKSGALVAASRGTTQRYQVWKVDFSDGSAQPLTKDSASYLSISLDVSGSRMIATQVSNNFHLVRSALDHLDRKETLAEPAWNFDFDSEGNIVYQSDASGDFEIWRMDNDGTSQRQLTNSPGDDSRPVIAQESGELFFTSNRTGQMQVWKMKLDGSDQRQVTHIDGGFPLFANREWAYYQHGVDRTLRRVSLKKGAEELVLNRAPERGPFVFSPSGKLAAFADTREGKPAVIVVSIPDGSELNHFEVAGGTGRAEFAWLPDESALAYSLSGEEETNALWVQPLDGSSPYQSAQLTGDPIIFLSFKSKTNSVAFVQGRWIHDVVMLHGLK